MRGLRAAVAFLTRLPVGASDLSPDLVLAVPWFAVVGGLLGAGVAAVYSAARWVLPPLLASTLAVGCGVLLTGALHEDGLADTVDALGGGRTRDEALRILNDPAHGTYGILAIAISLLLRIEALAEMDRWLGLAVLASAHALSRAASIGLLGITRAATNVGLAASFAAVTGRRQILPTLLGGFAIALAALGIWGLAAAFLAGLGASVVGWLSVRKLGGVNGDVLGAAQQAAEVLVLLLGTFLVTRGFSAAWWAA